MADTAKKVIDISIDDILPNRNQPRRKFDADEMYELSETVKSHGVFHPILVRPLGDKYELVVGERRYKATILANQKTIPAVIMNLNDKDSLEISIIENCQRTELSPIEEAVSYKKRLEYGDINQEELARKVGKTQSTISNKLRLLSLDDSVQQALLDRKISERHARSLLRLIRLSDQKLMLKRIINERLTVRKTDEEIDKMLKDSVDITPEMIDIEENQPKLDTVVEEVSDTIPLESSEDVESLFNAKFQNEIFVTEPKKNITESSVMSTDTKEEVKPISVAPADIEKIEKESLSVFDTKPKADVPSLLKSENDTDKDEEENVNDILKPGRFFNFTPEPTKEETKPSGNQPFNFGNFEPVPAEEIEIKEEPTIPKFEVPVSKPEEEILIPPMNTVEQSNDTLASAVQKEPTIVIPNEEELMPTMPGAKKAPINEAVEIIRNAVRQIENLGFEVDVDEIDLESIYQLIIKIDK